MKKIFLIFLLLQLFATYVGATCTPNNNDPPKPGKDSPDCAWDQNFPNYETCTNFINKYVPNYGFGRVDCVSTPANNNYLSPTLLLRSKLCVFGICVTSEMTIEKNKCVWFGLLRFCARETPNDNVVSKSDRKNLPLLGNNCPAASNPNNPNLITYPSRLCAFEDPMDGYDSNPSYSPYNHNEPNQYRVPQNQFVQKNVGCIDLPLAPGPPPYCPSINYYPQADVNRFCSLNESPTPENNCVLGKFIDDTPSSVADRYQHDSFFTPRVRISYSNLLGKCADPTSKNCVQFQQSSNVNPLFAYPCDVAPANSSVCVKLSSPIFPILAKYSSGNLPFRVLYDVKNNSGNLILSQTHWKDLSNYVGYTQTISGIDIGDYSDISLIYNTPSNDPVIGTNARSTTTVVDSFSDDQVSVTTQNQFELCVNPGTSSSSASSYMVNLITETANNLFSFPRSPMPYPPLVAKCGQSICGRVVNCLSTPQDPKLVICLQDESNNAQIGILSKSYNPQDQNNDFPSDNVYYLYGAKFQLLITDDSYAGFDVNYFPNPSSTANGTNVYFDSNSMYQSGGTKVCALGYVNQNKLRLAQALYVTVSNSNANQYSKTHNFVQNAPVYASFSPNDLLPLGSGDYYSTGTIIKHVSGKPSADIQNDEILRPNTALEDGLCLPISSSCPADNSSPECSWNSASSGTVQTGTCNAGYSTQNGKPPSRPCNTTGDITAPGAPANICVKN